MCLVFLCDKKALLDGVQVRFHLRRQKLRQKKVASRLKLSDSQFCHLLEGRYYASPKTIAALSGILKVPHSSIVLQNGDRHEK